MTVSEALDEIKDELVGKKHEFSGGIFSHKKDLPNTEFDVLNIRQGTARVENITEIRETGKSSYSHPTFELLLKNSSMSRAQWSRPFPIRKINFNTI